MPPGVLFVSEIIFNFVQYGAYVSRMKHLQTIGNFKILFVYIS